jgi:hypothetical protein
MHAADKLRIIMIKLAEDQEFENALIGTDKFNKLRAYFEDRLSDKTLDKDFLAVMPKLYLALKRNNEVMHVVPRSESRKISGIPQMAAEVIIRFTTFHA